MSRPTFIFLIIASIIRCYAAHPQTDAICALVDAVKEGDLKMFHATLHRLNEGAKSCTLHAIFKQILQVSAVNEIGCSGLEVRLTALMVLVDAILDLNLETKSGMSALCIQSLAGRQNVVTEILQTKGVEVKAAETGCDCSRDIRNASDGLSDTDDDSDSTEDGNDEFIDIYDDRDGFIDSDDGSDYSIGFDDVSDDSSDIDDGYDASIDIYDARDGLCDTNDDPECPSVMDDVCYGLRDINDDCIDTSDDHDGFNSDIEGVSPVVSCIDQNEGSGDLTNATVMGSRVIVEQIGKMHQSDLNANAKDIIAVQNIAAPGEKDETIESIDTVKYVMMHTKPEDHHSLISNPAFSVDMISEVGILASRYHHSTRSLPRPTTTSNLPSSTLTLPIIAETFPTGFVPQPSTAVPKSIST